MLNRTDRSRIGNWWWTVDYATLGMALMLLVWGIIMVMAAGPPVAERIGLSGTHFNLRHMVFAAGAGTVMLVVSIFSPRAVRIVSLIGLAGIFGLMVATLFFGPEVKGATRWLTIGGFRLQPSEFSKPFFAIVCAWLLTLWREGILERGWIWAGGVIASLVFILVQQPDIGMTAVLVITWGAQMFLAGMPWLLVIMAAGLAPLALLIAYLTLPHVEKRIDGFLDGTSFQTERSIQSFAEGGLIGVGPGNGSVKQSLPDAHADFIFSVMAEEYGLLTCLFVMMVYLFIIFRSYFRCFETDNMFSVLAVGGLTAQFGIQAAIHMGSSMDVIPTKGMTLPFISYGGSSLLTSGLTIGFILALTRKSTPLVSLDNVPQHHYRRLA